MNELHLFVYGEIGGGMFSEGATTSEDVQKEITAHPEAKEIIVHISSPGGGVFEGWTIGNILKNSGKKTTAKIEGFCASIATYIALSCQRVEMAEVGRFLIHNPSLGLEGEQVDLEKAAVQLESIKEDLINTYKSKTGMSSSQLSKMMDDETSMTAGEAKAFGFIDAFMTPIKAVAKFDINKNKMAEKKQESKLDLSMLDKIIKKAEKVIADLLPRPQNVVVELEDGSTIFVESEDGELEGKMAFTEEGGDPVADGIYPLTDGRVLTVEDGIVTSVAEDSPEEVVDKLKAQIEALEAAAQAANEETTKVKAESQKNLTELLIEVKNLKRMTAGSTEPPKKAIHEPTNKFEAQTKGHRMDAFADYIKNSK